MTSGNISGLKRIASACKLGSIIYEVSGSPLKCNIVTSETVLSAFTDCIAGEL